MLNFFFLLPAKHDWYFEIDFSLGLAVLILYVIHSFQCTSLLYESIKTKSLNSLLVELNVNACLVNLLNYPVFAIKKKRCVRFHKNQSANFTRDYMRYDRYSVLSS